MKALMIKDLYSLKETKLFIIMILVAALVTGITGNAESVGFIISYVTILAGNLVLNAMAYDELDNGYSFLFTLPVSRNAYVLEKYIFAWLTGGLGWIFSVALSAVLASRGNMEFFDLMIMAAGVLGILIIMQDIMIPVQLKFGGQKGKIAMILVMVCFFSVSFVLMNTAEQWMIWGSLQQAAQWKLWGAGILAMVLFTILSFVCSFKIINNKEF